MLTPDFARLTLPYFKNIILLQKKTFKVILTLSGVYSYIVFTLTTQSLLTEIWPSNLRDVFFYSLFKFSNQNLAYPFFALTKHVNAVSLKLHWTAGWISHGNLLEFLPDIYSPVLRILRTVFLLLFQIISSVVQSSAIWLMHIARRAMRTLCSVRKKTSARSFRSCANPRGFTILYKEWPTHQFYWPMDILGARLGFFPPLPLPLEPLEGSLHLGQLVLQRVHLLLVQLALKLSVSLKHRQTNRLTIIKLIILLQCFGWPNHLGPRGYYLKTDPDPIAMGIRFELCTHKHSETNTNWHCMITHAQLCYRCILSAWLVDE